MKKKGFTLIELLAVIVILAVIALIVTPIVSDVIASAKDSANKRSVEGHVKNIEYAIVNSTFDGGLNTNLYDCIDSTDTVDLLTLPDSDPITCESYTIVNGLVTKALQCTAESKGWDKKYNYIKGVGVTQTSGNNDMFEYVDLDPTTNVSNSDTSSLSIEAGSYFVVLSYAKSNTSSSQVSSDVSFSEISLNSGNAVCSIIDQEGKNISGTEQVNSSYLTLNNFIQVYKCNSNEDTTLSYTSSSSTTSPQEIIISAIKVTGNENFEALGSGGEPGGGSGNGGGTPVAGPTSTLANGQTVYEGRYLPAVKTVYFNVSTGQKCINSDWSSNGGNTSNEMNSGCLKFYAYMEDDLSYTMILDRNTTWAATWASSGNNSSGPITALAQLKTDTDSWQGTIIPSNYTNVYMANGAAEASYVIPYDTDEYKARFITSDEVAKIVGKTDFSSVSTNTDGWYYLDGNTLKDTDPTWHTRIATSSQQSAVAWLYNYTCRCTGYGCQASGNGCGYWTSDSIPYTTNNAWLVSNMGMVDRNIDFGLGYGSLVRINNTNISGTTGVGIRPVVTILKSLID